MFCSIRSKILGLLAAGFVATAMSVVLLAQIQLKATVDNSQRTIYEDKIKTIVREIEQTVSRLHKTGQTEAYEDAFKSSLLKKMRNTYYVGDELRMYPFIIDTSGSVVMHPVFPRGDKTLSGQDYVQKMLSLRNGDFDYVYYGEKKWCIAKLFEDWNWVVGYAIPHEIKYADVRALRNMLIAVIAGITGAVLSVLFVVIARLLRPIVILTAASKAMAEGDFDHEVEIRSRDEMEVLAGSFLKMRDSVKKQILELDGLLLAVQQGRLDTRGNAEAFAGCWQRLVLGINDVIDAFAVPITMTSAYLDRLSKGDIPKPIAEEYKGNFNTIRKNLNLLIDATSGTALIAEEIAVGNLTAEVSERSDDDRMMRALNRMIQRLNGIMKETNGMIQAVEQGKLDIRGNAEAFEGGWRELVTGVNRLIGGLRSAVSEKAVLNQEMELARRIQTSLLPILADNFHPDFQIAAAMVPADRVGGDFYDITYDKTGNLWFAIGDVSGHGVTPGLIMMMAQTVHATVTANLDCEARDTVVKINEMLYKNVHERLNESHFMTFTALKYLGHGRFQHAGAHLSMIVFRQKTGDCELVRTKGVYLNFKKDISKGTMNSELRMDPGDILVLYTDGLTEAETPDGKMLDIGGFVKIVEKHAHQEPESMKEMIMADVMKWCDNRRFDDMSMVIAKMKGN
jgi:serine phosphatase RsbU (regulator of sigma subunit)/HAMP domain-containing protein